MLLAQSPESFSTLIDMALPLSTYELPTAICHAAYSNMSCQCERRLHASGTVNADDLAVHPLAILRGEEADNPCNIDGLADTVHG